MGCCDDPTEPVKVSRSDLVQIQEQYGNLVRDLLTSDPEKVIIKQLDSSNSYLRELAALNAHFNSVKKRAIELLEKDSVTILQRIADKESGEISQCALQRLEELKKDHSILGKIFN